MESYILALPYLVPGTLFIVTGIVKCLMYSGFLNHLKAYALLPSPLIAPAATAIITGELFAGVGISFRLLGPIPGIVGMGLLAAFTTGIVVNIARGRTGADCGCGAGTTRSPIGWRLVIRNVILITFLLVSIGAVVPSDRQAVALAVFLSVGFVVTVLGDMSPTSSGQKTTSA